MESIERRLNRARDEVVGRLRLREQAIERLQQTKTKHAAAELHHVRVGQAAGVVREVAKATQDQFAFRVSQLVTTALEGIFPDPYEFVIDFVDKRGTVEADVYLRRGDKRYDVMEATGGGVVDTISLVLRVALWSLARPRRRNVLVLDEPLRFLSRDRQADASRMLARISRELGLQMIIVTHEEELIEQADTVFRVQHNGERSLVRFERRGGEVGVQAQDKPRQARRRRA